MKNKWLSTLLAIALCTCMCACGAQKESSVSDNTKSSDYASVASDESSKSDFSEETIETGLTKAELDLYGEVKDSNYMSVILYNPDLDSEKIHENAVISIYDMNGPINKDFQFMLEDNKLHCFALGSDQVSFSEVISNNRFKDGHASVYETHDFNEEYQYPSVTARIFTNTIIKEKADLEEYYAEDKYYVYGDNWNSMTKLEDFTSYIALQIDETETEAYYAQVQLPENVENSDARTEIIDTMVKEENFKNTIVELTSLTDLTSVVDTYGKEVALTDTIIYQDLIATAISERYGLNLRDKHTFLHSDKTYIKYTPSEGASVSFECVSPLREYDSYETVYELYKDNKFEYTDTNGNTYEYFGQYRGISVFKNQEFMGKITIETDNPFKTLNRIFGIK